MVRVKGAERRVSDGRFRPPLTLSIPKDRKPEGMGLKAPSPVPGEGGGLGAAPP